MRVSDLLEMAMIARDDYDRFRGIDVLQDGPDERLDDRKDVARQLDLPSGVRGVVVTGVDADSGAADLQKGDVIEEVNQQPVPSLADYKKVVSSLDPNQTQVLSVCRHRSRSFLVLRPR